MVSTAGKIAKQWPVKTLNRTSGWMLGAFLLCGALPTVAQIERQHAAHVHGEGSGSLAIDAESLSMVLEMPGFNVVGFEHAPNNSAQRAELQNALSILNAGQWLTLDPRGDCEVSKQLATAEGFGNEAVSSGVAAEDNHNHHNEHNDHHTDDHNHDNSHAHGHDHEDEHAQFKIEIEAVCQAMDALGWVNMDLFSSFPNNEHITLNVLTQTNAFQARLAADETRIDLK